MGLIWQPHPVCTFYLRNLYVLSAYSVRSVYVFCAFFLRILCMHSDFDGYALAKFCSLGELKRQSYSKKEGRGEYYLIRRLIIRAVYLLMKRGT